MDNGSPIEWETFEYDDHNRGTDWYWAIGLIALSLAVSAVIFDNYLFAILIVIATFSLYLFSVRKPLRISVSIGEDGIRIGNDLYRYGTLKSFWIEKKDGREKLLLQSTKTLLPLLSLSIEKVSGESVRGALAPHLPETELHEPFTHALIDYLGL